MVLSKGHVNFSQTMVNVSPKHVGWTQWMYLMNKYYASVGVIEEVYNNMRVHGMEYFITQKSSKLYSSQYRWKRGNNSATRSGAHKRQVCPSKYYWLIYIVILSGKWSKIFWSCKIPQSKHFLFCQYLKHVDSMYYWTTKA